MAKRRHHTQNGASVTNKLKKSKRNVNNNEPEQSENESEDGRSSVVSASSQMSSASQTKFSRCGKILAVKLKNFMCHENLTVEFNSQANLLIGKNGSGKSAVLTALIIGLGCKANATNRSSSIKQLIRTGESSATIEVHLSNDGFDSYERENFGDKIVIIRQINASGSSTYKLKNGCGDIISTKRADLQKLIFYMNIQVDNPVCVLTQDAARSFLRDSDPKKRYELFLKATQLNTILEKLAGCSVQLKSAMVSLNTQQEHSEELEKKYQDAAQVISRLKSLNPIKEDILRFKTEKKWCGVVIQEAFIQEIQNTLEETANKKNKMIEKTRNRTNNVESLNEQAAQINSSIDALIQACNENRQRYDAQRLTFRETSERYDEKSREVKRLEGKKKRIKDDIQNLENRVTNNDNNEVAQLKLEHQQQATELENRKGDVQLMITNSKRDINMMANNEGQCRIQIHNLEAQRKSIVDDIVRTQQQLQQLNQNSSNSSLPSYGEYMPAFVKDIKRLHDARKFSKMPIGPLGAYIEVKNPKYCKYVEDCCKRIVNAFIVDNPQDGAVLKSLIKRSYSQASSIPIITMKFRDRMYDVRGKRVAPDSRYDVLMDVVNIENPNVMNCFIDQCKADSVVFVTEFEDATRLTDKVENVPPNLARVLLLEPCSEFFPAPNYRSYSLNVASTARYLRVTPQLSEEYFNTELEKLKENKSSVEADIFQVKKKQNESVKIMNDRKNGLVALENDIRELDRKIYEIKNYEYPEETELAVMNREIDAQKKILVDTDTKLSAESTQQQALDDERKQLEAEIKEIRRTMKNLEEEKLDKQKEKDNVVEEIEKCRTTANYVRQQIQKFDDAINKLNAELTAANEKLAKATALARKSGNRPEVVHSEEEVDDMIKKLERKISMIDSSNISMEQAQATFNECKKNLDENESLVASLDSVITKARESTKQRFNKIKTFKRSMTNRVNYYFQRLMALRKFKGDLVFNEDALTLDLHVIPRDKDQVNVASGTNSLSGGERSYVTVSLLMSLWKCVDHPFFFLDEYDVFTDHVNRKYLTDILLGEAVKHPEFQYTFLTPQDIANIRPSECLSIQRLKEPTR